MHFIASVLFMRFSQHFSYGFSNKRKCYRLCDTKLRMGIVYDYVQILSELHFSNKCIHKYMLGNTLNDSPTLEYMI